mmetsp:Transcript_49682/g.94943  ORF Transcript_49682/g.94943 Transcript_49682/m.94943 type:complete len:150 (+) Transcript_49682:343-792(+)
MAMIFTLVQSAKEQLREIVTGCAGNEMDERAAQIAREEAEKAAKEAARRAGTPVTESTWAAWFERFRAEEALEKAKIECKASDSMKQKNKLSGRAYFESRGQEYIEDEEADEDFDNLEEDYDDDDLLDDFLESTEQDALAAGQQAHVMD